MPEEDASKQKRSAFVEDPKVTKMNRTLRKDAVLDDESVVSRARETHHSPVHFDSTKNIIKSQDFRFNPKPFVVGGTVDPNIKEPEVEVIKDTNGTVTKIKVKCTCGREVDIDCLY
jgi:hypothetical protein